MAKKWSEAARAGLDSILKHEIRMHSLAEGTTREMQMLAASAERRLISQLRSKLNQVKAAGGLDQSPAATVRLSVMIEELRDVARRGFGKIPRALQGELYAVANYEREWASQATQLSVASLAGSNVRLGDTTVQVAGISEAAARKLVSSTPMQGVLLKEWAERYPDRYVDAISKAVRDGVFVGQTPEEIIASVRGTEAERLLDGALAPVRRELATVVRSAHAQVTNSVREAVYRENSDVIQGFEWVATLDDSTCEECAVRDGLRWTLDYEPIDHDVPYEGGPGGLHWNCRCVVVGVVEPGLVSDTERETFGDWAQRQDQETLAGLFGKERAALLESGAIKYKELWGAKGKFLSLDEIRSAEGIAKAKKVLKTGKVPKPAKGDVVEAVRGTAKDLTKLSRALDKGENVDSIIARQKAKDTIVKDIATRLRKSQAELFKKAQDWEVRNMVNEVVHGWARTSGDGDKRAVAVQLAARKVFGGSPAVKHLSNTLSSAEALLKKAPRAFFESVSGDMFGANVTTSNVLEAILKAQYEQTQTWFAKQGIKEVTLVRGVGGSGITGSAQADILVKGEIATKKIALQPLSSFSSKAQEAMMFGENLFIVRVPVSQVFSTARTGFGCLNEYEFVVLGNAEMKAITVVTDTMRIGSRLPTNVARRMFAKHVGEVDDLLGAKGKFAKLLDVKKKGGEWKWGVF